jgi:hypothetical protein
MGPGQHKPFWPWLSDRFSDSYVTGLSTLPDRRARAAPPARVSRRARGVRYNPPRCVLQDPDRLQALFPIASCDISCRTSGSAG